MRTAIAYLTVGLVLGGCQYEARALLELPITAGGMGEQVLQMEDGAEVRLSAASVTFSDLRLEEPPSADLASVISELPLLLVSSRPAYAHPGHDYPGDVAGELLGTYTVDLLGEEQSLGSAPCYEGEYATGRVQLSGTAAIFEGQYADALGNTVPFRFEVSADQDIIGIPFETYLEAGALPSAVALRFDVRAALQFVDWSVGDADGDGLLTMGDAPYGNTVTFGTVATPSWSLSLVP